MAMMHIIMVQYVTVPAAILVLSVFVGRKHLPIKYIWFVPIAFSAGYLLCRLSTQSLLQFVLTGVAASPGMKDFLAIIAISMIGLLFGMILSRNRKA